MRKQEITIYEAHEATDRAQDEMIIGFSQGGGAVYPLGELDKRFRGEFIFRDELLPKPERTASDLLRFIEDKNLKWDREELDDVFVQYTVYGIGILHDWADDSEGWLSDCVNYLMDEAEGRVH